MPGGMPGGMGGGMGGGVTSMHQEVVQTPDGRTVVRTHTTTVSPSGQQQTQVHEQEVDPEQLKK